MSEMSSMFSNSTMLATRPCSSVYTLYSSSIENDTAMTRSTYLRYSRPSGRLPRLYAFQKNSDTMHRMVPNRITTAQLAQIHSLGIIRYCR